MIRLDVMAVRRVLAVAAGVALGGCGAVLGFEDIAYENAGEDGGASDGSVPEGATASDSAIASDSSDIDADGGPSLPLGCERLVAHDTFDQVDPRWRVYGSATFDIDAAVLTPDQGAQAGAIWIAVSPPAKRFHATLKLRVKSVTSAPADGITVAWMPASAPDAGVGASGNAMGLCAGEIDTAAAAFIATQPPTSIAIRTVNGTSCSSELPVDSAITDPTEIDIRYDDVEQTASANVNDASIEAGVGAFPIGWIGFTGGTGSLHARHWIDDVTIDVCR